LSSLLALFDFPPPSITSEQRNVTNVPLQKLFFMNSSLVMNEAGLLAERLNVAAPDDEARIRQAYRLLFGREATGAEVKLGLEFLRSVQADAESAWAQSVPAGGALRDSTAEGATPAAASDRDVRGRLAESKPMAADATKPQPHPSAWQQYAQVLLSSNEFMFVN
jgi:hypothetical protein